MSISTLARGGMLISAVVVDLDHGSVVADRGCQLVTPGKMEPQMKNCLHQICVCGTFS